MVRRLSSLVVFVLLGGCALLTGANELETGSNTSSNATNPDGSSGSSGGGGTSGASSSGLTSSSGSLPDLDGSFLPPFPDGGTSGTPGPTLDGGSFPDGAKPDPRAGIICGSATCAPGAHCCLTGFGTYSCGTSCSTIGDLTCDDAYDCPGKVCCASYTGSLVGASKCMSSCSDPDGFIMCAGDQDCPTPQKCEQVTSPLGGKYRGCNVRD